MQHFTWILSKRQGVWSADGRSNSIKLGRYSLGTRDRYETKKLLAILDQNMAVLHGLAEPRSLENTEVENVSFVEGRKLYEDHVRRSPLLGGTRATSQKRYRTVLDKFLRYAAGKGMRFWNQVSSKTLQGYLGHLQEEGYAYRTQYLEGTTLKQVVSFLVSEKKLPVENKIALSLTKPRGTDTYCWKPIEVQAILAFCAEKSELHWLRYVILALSCTGLRIGELIGLRWSNILFDSGMIHLEDETLSSRKPHHRDRQTTKGGYNRAFPIHSESRPVLESLARHSDGYVFHGPLGGRLKADTVRNILIRDILKPLECRFPTAESEIGFANGRLHSFRHFFCSLCASQGVSQNVVMLWLGHRDSKLVQHYFHLHDDVARAQMQRISLEGSTTGALPVV